MEKAMESSQKLGGKIVGIGKVHKDGSIDYRELEKPIHNRVVSGGLDYLMTYDGTNNTYAYYDIKVDLYRGSNRNGCLKFMQAGTDGSSTAFTDTALKSPVGAPVDSLPFTGGVNCGSYVTDASSNQVRMRISMQTEAMASDTTLREVGFFGKYPNSSNYTMFSRVVLPSAIEVLTGEKLIVTYELTVTYDNAEHDISSKLTGLLDSEGNSLKGIKKFCSLHSTSFNPSNVFGTFSDNLALISLILPSGGGYQLTYPSNYKNVYPDLPLWAQSSNQTNFKALGYSVDSSYDFPIDWSTSTPTNTLFTVNETLTTWNLLDYTPGDFYRDVELTVQPTWAISGTDTYADIYAICYRGIAIKFGYYDTTDPDNPVWVRKPWRKPITQSVKFRFRKSVSAA